jgi:hypothetical protein
MRPAITETVHLSLQAAADDVNRRGIATAIGKQSHARQVRCARHHLGI